MHKRTECPTDTAKNIQRWLRETLTYLTQNPYESSSDVEKWITDLEAKIPESDEKFTSIQQKFVKFLRESIAEEVETQNLIRVLMKAVNHEYLLEIGQYVSMQEGGSTEVGMPVSFNVHRIDEFETPMGVIHSLMASRVFDPEKCMSPCYEGGNDVIRLEPIALLTEVGVMLAHTNSRKFGDQFSTEYRRAKADRDYARYIWGLLGNESDKAAMARIVTSESTPYKRWERILKYPICQSMLSGTLAEEIRHGIDIRHQRKILLESTDDEIDELYLLRTLFKQESSISHGFLYEPIRSERQAVMLTKTMLEFTGKLTAISGGTSPQLVLAHIINTLEKSRIRIEKRSHTFRDELVCASSDEGALKSWEHAFAVKMIAVYLGNHFDLTNTRLNFDAEFDHLELIDVLKKMLEKTPNEIRQGIKEATDVDFVIPVDCLPFAKIQQDGSLECADCASCDSPATT